MGFRAIDIQPKSATSHVSKNIAHMKENARGAPRGCAQRGGGGRLSQMGHTAQYAFRRYRLERHRRIVAPGFANVRPMGQHTGLSAHLTLL
jgi:hypothetical protein